MKLILILTAGLLVSSPALSATDQVDQINSIYAVQQKSEAASAAAVSARQAEHHERLRVQAVRSHVNRENEFIDSQLKRQTAETDMVQSSADANRNVSSGVKTYLEKSGEAEAKGASKKSDR